MVYGRPSRPLEEIPARQPWSEVKIRQLRGLAQVRPGEVLPLEFQAVNAAGRPLKLSMRLIDAAGHVIAQHDVNAEPAQRLGLFVPPAAAPGPYQLSAVLYDAVTQQVIADQNGSEQATLAQVEIKE